MPPLNLGDEMPNLTVVTNEGTVKMHDFLANSWAILFSHPRDYTPVCTTELGRACTLAPEFAKRKVKMIALSCDDADSHNGWIKDVQSHANHKGDFPYQIIADDSRDVAKLLGMIDPDESAGAGMPLTCRAVMIFGPDKRLKLSMLYPATTGRNFTEILRVIDSLQLTATKKVATPVDWKVGEKCMVVPSVKKEEEAGLFPKGVETLDVPSGKGYLRMTPQPE
ncbi:PRDX6 [Branchiostoma lanceolatum]|uniref:Peroxiredoxin-6 n=1 Tax=Branchiostoma lanceolatum TaxID=7740 RepID=A0A8K0A881_BRALA|nr:PRDX6 [Branchiostoma lanceolatum]